MAAILGKRKRNSAVTEAVYTDRSHQRPESPVVDPQEIFRRHFEAQFKPLPQIEKPTERSPEVRSDDSEEESDWEGISDEEENVVTVVEHQHAQSHMAPMSKDELKSFMVCRQVSRIKPL
jgi:hypothetical protein